MKNKAKKEIINPSKSDFLVEQLPTTRRKEFFDILKNEWRTLLLVGFVLTLFFLPFIISKLFEAGFMNGNAEALRNTLTAQGKTTEEINSAVAAQMRSIHLLFSGINIICFMIFSVGLAGVARIIKCLSFSEGVVFKSDFFTGIKKYWSAFLTVGFFSGLFYFLMTYTSETISVMSSENQTLLIVRGLIIGFYFAILVPLFFFSFAQATLYTIPFFSTITNSIRFTVNKYYICIIFSIIMYAIYLLTHIVYALISVLCLIVVILLIAPLIMLAFHLFALSLFDKYINKDNYPQNYKKGLYIKEAETNTIKEK